MEALVRRAFAEVHTAPVLLAYHLIYLLKVNDEKRCQRSMQILQNSNEKQLQDNIVEIELIFLS